MEKILRTREVAGGKSSVVKKGLLTPHEKRTRPKHRVRHRGDRQNIRRQLVRAPSVLMPTREGKIIKETLPKTKQKLSSRTQEKGESLKHARATPVTAIKETQKGKKLKLIEHDKARRIAAQIYEHATYAERS